MYNNSNIGDLIRYIQYNNFEVINSSINSIFDFRYSSYSEKLLEFVKKNKKVSHRVRGVGGYEYVYEKIIESITAPNIDISNFLVEVGDMDYGFNINAILGTDFLRRAKAKINMENLTLELKM